LVSEVAAMKALGRWVWFRVLATRPRSRTVAPALAIVTSLVLASCDGSPVAGSDPPEGDPVAGLLLEVWSYPDSVQGILSPATVYVRVRTADGEPVPDHEVTWHAREGEVGQWSVCANMCPIWERSREITQRTDELGEIRTEWILGPEVGEQEIEITAPGAEPVRHRIQADPGVVLVGLFTLKDEEEQANLQSDTMRVHATNYRAYAGHFFGVQPILDGFDEGDVVHLAGWTSRGAGFDPAWNFHIDPSFVTRGAWGTHLSCWVVPRFTEEWMDQILGDRYSAWWQPCSGVLRLVGVEEVPASYLAGLAAEAVGRRNE
jgi:hypothetical protein